MAVSLSQIFSDVRRSPEPPLYRAPVEAGRPSAPSPLDKPPVRWIQLDVLRGVAILMVLGRHTPFAIPDTTRGASLYAAWMRGGWAGVDLFFVLSGFLIGGLLLGEHRKHGQIRFGRFFLRRAFKIWPTYLVFLAAGFVRDVLDVAPADVGLGLAARMRQSAAALWPFLIHIQNYKETEIHAVIGTAWSLAVEEHFYLLLPLLLFVLGRRTGRRNDPLLAPSNPYRLLPWIGAGLAIVCLALRFHARRLHPEWNEFAHHLPTHLRIDSLFAGVALAYGVHFARPRIESLRRFRWPILLASIACFLPFARDSHAFAYTSLRTTTIGYTALMIGSMGLVLAAWFGSQSAPSAAPAPVWLPRATPRWILRLSTAAMNAMAMIGARSYSIYLFHVLLAVPVVMWLRPAVGHLPPPLQVPLSMALYLSLAIAFGGLAYHFIEAPSVTFRDWLFPARAQAPVFIPATQAPADIPHRKPPTPARAIRRRRWRSDAPAVDGELLTTDH